MKVLGLLDTLESVILDGFKFPLTKKVMVNEEQVLKIIDKIRLVLQGGDEFQKTEKVERKVEISMAPAEALPETDKGKATEIVQQAYLLAKEIREGADKYADEVLSNLELSTSRVLRTIKAGRDRLVKTVQGKVEDAES
ncbi:MAG: hypothetical protein WC624_05125 [Candidatus Margulisiibacteriota bacterium]